MMRCVALGVAAKMEMPLSNLCPSCRSFGWNSMYSDSVYYKKHTFVFNLPLTGPPNLTDPLPSIRTSMDNYLDRHDAVGAWFLGPRAENFRYLEHLFKYVLDEQEKARKGYFPKDNQFVSSQMQASDLFKENMAKLDETVKKLGPLLAEHSVPFWNPRYCGHMVMDTTMPGMIGYLMAMMYNSNNVATEASPVTSVIEIIVGKQLCEMVGFNVDVNHSPVGWGHITCGGSIANLESMWSARNLKFYPLSLTLAMDKGGPLEFIADSFSLSTCTGDEKLIKNFTTWELLNIVPEVVLDIPDRLYKQYSFTPTFLQSCMNDYIIQSTSKDSEILEERFGREQLKNMAYMTSATKHYSWPKGAAITGIGSANLLAINVDESARMDIVDLRKRLEECLSAKRAVYAVVAIMGTTEHGAVDPLKEIIDLRNEFRSKGLSFVLHGDAAWGAYFCTTLQPVKEARRPGFVPAVPLKKSTQDGLRHLRFCDSVTVDPHKSGYIQYPAGGLLYRDERMRHLVTWTSPVIFSSSEEESIGTYGIEGSKPGAAPVAVWLSHQVIGLNPDGYGTLLCEANFSAVKMYTHLATMSKTDTEFIVAPLNMLPAEMDDGDVEAQKQFIRDRIMSVPNSEIVEDAEAMELLPELGSDLAINAFAINFKVNGKINDDIAEANDLGRRVFKRLSISSIHDHRDDKPLLLTSSALSQSNYSKCLTNLKSRVGLKGEQDLFILINVVMSPFPTDADFTGELCRELQQVIEEEVQVSKFRNTVTPDIHGFVMQGLEKLYLVHLPMFSMANQRFQLVITGDLPPVAMEAYVDARRKNPTSYFTLANAKKEILADMLERGSFEAVINQGLPDSASSHFMSRVKLTNIRVILQRRLDSKFISSAYPRFSMPFYIYGTEKERHITHALVAAPNIQLCADQVQLAIKDMPSGEGPFVAHFIHVPEHAMQPFPPNEKIQIQSDPPFFFRPGAEFEVELTADLARDPILAKGKVTLSKNIFVDTNMLNMDPVISKAPSPAVDHRIQKSSPSFTLTSSFDHYVSAKTGSHHALPLLEEKKKSWRREWHEVVVSSTLSSCFLETSNPWVQNNL
ncbi:PLP-dependent transferase [Rickenella mellea]|uniref:PLP-dependent transferase n=1 Tax=Rickenella mellea TaxID=50990 RepID=A0A4Y7PZR9_9AGAM|nr:PLP-dependent transferase [Rickenella mellea]